MPISEISLSVLAWKLIHCWGWSIELGLVPLQKGEEYLVPCFAILPKSEFPNSTNRFHLPPSLGRNMNMK